MRKDGPRAFAKLHLAFNTLMNKVILTERAKAEERKDNKRKFLESKARQ
jgi:hypothetical protein